MIFAGESKSRELEVREDAGKDIDCISGSTLDGKLRSDRCNAHLI